MVPPALASPSTRLPSVDEEDAQHCERMLPPGTSNDTFSSNAKHERCNIHADGASEESAPTLAATTALQQSAESLNNIRNPRRRLASLQPEVCDTVDSRPGNEPQQEEEDHDDDENDLHVHAAWWKLHAYLAVWCLDALGSILVLTPIIPPYVL
jgi:hypothetical protein